MGNVDVAYDLMISFPNIKIKNISQSKLFCVLDQTLLEP